MVALAAGCALLPGVVGTGTGSAQAANSGDGLITRVATLPLPGTWESVAGFFMAIDESARRVIVERDTDTPKIPPENYNQRMFFVYDADTFKLLQAVPFPGEVVGHGAYAVDEQNHRLFFAGRGGANVASLYVYDTRDMTEPLGRFDGLPVNWYSTGLQPGFAYQESSGLLYVITSTGDARNGEIGPRLYAFDPDQGEIVWRFDLRPRYCESPASIQPAQLALGFSQDERHLFSVCQVADARVGSTGVVRFALSEDPRRPPIGAEVFPGITPGSRPANSVWAPGIDRMVSVFRTENQGQGAYVFDSPTTSYIATPGVLVPPGNAPNVKYELTPPFAVDRTRGRVYFQGPAVATDPQTGCETIFENSIATLDAETLEVNRYPSGDRALGAAPLATVFDSQRRRFWMIDRPMVANRECGENEAVTDGTAYLAVFEDSTPPPRPPLAPDPDAATQDIPEVDGITGANVSIDASAYAARFQLTPGGVDSALSFGTLKFADCATPKNPGFKNPLVPPSHDSVCRLGGREAIFAQAPSVSLDSQEAFASATALALDPDSTNDLSTTTDLTSPGPYVNSIVKSGNETAEDQSAIDLPGAGQVFGVDPSQPCNEQTANCLPPAETTPSQFVGGQRFPVEPSVCGDHDADDETVQDLERQHGYVGQWDPAEQKGQRDPFEERGMESSVSCDLGGWSARAAATTNSASAGLPVTAGRSQVSVTVERTKEDGAVAEVSSEVDSIAVGPYLTIGHLGVRARLHAHGRMGTSTVDTYECTVTGVVITPPGREPTMFPEADCESGDLKAAVDGLNEALIGRMRIEFPPAPTFSDVADERLPELRVVRSWSPGGYRADLRLAESRRLENLALLSDSAIEHPAIRVTAYPESNDRRNRFVASFGGVAASARYGIYRLTTFSCPLCGGNGGGGTDGVARAIFEPRASSLGPPVSAPPQVEGAEYITIEEAVAGQPVSQGPGSGLGAWLKTVVDGFRFLLQRPGALLAVLAAWTLLGWPWFVLSRRRALMAAVEGVR